MISVLWSCKSKELQNTTGWDIEGVKGWELIIEDHVIALDNGYLEKKEVTVKQYRQFLESIKESYGLDSVKSHLPQLDKHQFDYYDSLFATSLPWQYEKGKFEDMPAANVSFENAQSYCEWRGPYEIYQSMISEGIIKNDITFLQYLDREFFGYDVPQLSCCGCGEYRKIRVNDGLFLRKYTLPTISQWEAAAFMNLDSTDFKLGKILSKWYKKLDSNQLGLQLSDTNVLFEKEAWSECGRSFPGFVTYNYMPSPVSQTGIHPNGCYGITGNVSEMTAVKGISKGGNVRMKLKDTDLRKDYKYSKPSSVLGFRCVMTYEKPTAWE